jgi:hypothetical protein
MICNSVISQFNHVKRDGTQEHLGHHRPNWLSVSLVTDFVEPCVFVVTVDDEIRRTVVWVSFGRPLSTFHRVQLSDLTRCPLRDEILSDWHNISLSASSLALWNLLCGNFTHFTRESCRKIPSSFDPEIPVNWTNYFFRALLTYGHLRFCVNGHRNSTAIHIMSWCSSKFQLYYF